MAAGGTRVLSREVWSGFIAFLDLAAYSSHTNRTRGRRGIHSTRSFGQCPSLNTTDIWIDPYQDGYHPGTNVTVTCQNANHSLVGMPMLYCEEGGTWSAPTPTCVVCSEPDFPAHGSMVLHMENGSIATATYTCDPGYTLYGNLQVICLPANASWSGPPPDCLAQCQMPPSVTHGSSMVTCMHDGCDVTYVCDDGYRLIGPDTITCSPLGKWTNLGAACDVILCESPPDIEHGSYSTDGRPDPRGRYRPDTTATYSCDRAYNMSGVESKLCLANGTWTTGLPNCTPGDTQLELSSPALTEIIHLVEETHTIPSTTAGVDCPLPEPIAQGSYRRYGRFLVYRCEHSYVLHGQDERTCQDNGTWSGVAPRCVAMSPPLSSGPAQTFEWEEVFMSHSRWMGMYSFQSQEYEFQFTVEAVQKEQSDTLIGLITEDNVKFTVRGFKDTSGEIVLQTARLSAPSDRFATQDWYVRGHLVEHECTWSYVGHITSSIDGFDSLSMYAPREDVTNKSCDPSPNMLIVIIGVAVACVVVITLGVVVCITTRRHGSIRSSGHRTLTSFENPVYEYENGPLK